MTAQAAHMQQYLTQFASVRQDMSSPSTVDVHPTDQLDDLIERFPHHLADNPILGRRPSLDGRLDGHPDDHSSSMGESGLLCNLLRLSCSLCTKWTHPTSTFTPPNPPVPFCAFFSFTLLLSCVRGAFLCPSPLLGSLAFATRRFPFSLVLEKQRAQSFFGRPPSLAPIFQDHSVILARVYSQAETSNSFTNTLRDWRHARRPSSPPPFTICTRTSRVL
jgi:hypothetical protein